MDGAHRAGAEAGARVRRLAERLDKAQQRNRFLAVVIATWKKFGEDQAGNLAALIAYFAFASTFPLVLVFVTILNIVLHDNAKLREHLLTTALSQYPIIGQQLQNNVHGLTGTGVALGLGLIFTLFAALGVAAAMQNAVNAVWAIPMYQRPRFPWSILRSLGIVGVIGPGTVITLSLSSIAGGTGHLSGAASRIAAVAVSLALNIGLFWLGFRLATSREIAWRDLRISAVLAAVAWQALQVLGGYFIGHQLAHNSRYGVFGLVLGVLAWFFVEAQIVLYVVELNVVRVRRLWPRSLAPPPQTRADLRAHELYAEASQRSADLDISVRPREPQ
jgi:membrane protein